MTRVLLIDDHPIVLQGCRQILQDAGVRDIMEAGTAAAGYRMFLRAKPDVVAVDLALKGNRLGGLDLLRRMRTHNSLVPILVFSMHSDPFIVSRSLEAGATGYVQKDAGPKDFLEAFETVRARRPYLNHQLALQVALLGVRRDRGPLDDLTPRELQALTLLAEGKPYGQIANDLNVSYKTVANTFSLLKGKLGANNLPELIRLAIQYVNTPDTSRFLPQKKPQTRKSAWCVDWMALY